MATFCIATDESVAELLWWVWWGGGVGDSLNYIHTID
jgi:hypothetical protein